MAENILNYLENTVASYPDKTAIAMDDRSYSFAELKDLSSRLACAIPVKGQNKPIPVLVERDIDTLVLFLAVLYSGNFYVPVDCDSPIAKINDIIYDSGAEIILGSENTRALCEQLDFRGSFITMKDITDTEADMPVCEADTPLYMVYTSGSTGKPKGVLKGHGGMISFIEAYCDTFGFSTDEVIGNQTPFYFDASAKDIYLMLKTGATMEVIPTKHFSMPALLIEYLNQRKVTMISWVPTALAIVVALKTFKSIMPQTLKRVFFVGEVMPTKVLNGWMEYLPELQYVNLFGSSEIAGISTYYEINKQFANDESLPIGKPLKNCKIYLMNGDKLITEPGHKGEIYVASDALALEYYHDPEKTSACFMNRDFGDGECRCFKTGDLAQYDSEGNLVFASRCDFQIKHMGHRIELGEIETALNAVPFLRKACCLFNADSKKIVCFYEADAECKKEIIAEISKKLPKYMWPNIFKLYEALPLNKNGKIDRVKLKEDL